MKLLGQIAVTFFLCALLQSLLPWWSMAIGAFGVGYVFASRGVLSFLAGFLGVGLLWFLMSLYLDISTDSILTGKVASLFPTKTIPLLFILTSMTGGLVGGVSAMSGSLLSNKARE